ncbi:MAG TPA: SulP family inorganic anion transporter [Coriobacteriia bacterium]
MPYAPAEKQRLPLLQGILPLDREHLVTDALAGATLAALAIPEVMGYSRIAGMPVVTGLYTVLLPLVLFALFGASRHLVVGADSASAAVMAAGLTGMAVTGSREYMALAGMLALLTGVALLLARFVRIGFLADFLSRTVLIGFLTGVGVQVAAGQVAGMLGVPDGGQGLVARLITVARQLPRANAWTIGVSAAVLALIVAAERIGPRVPGALVAVVGAAVASSALNLPAHGVEVIGTMAGGLPRLAIPAPSMAQLRPLIPTALSLFLIVLAQSAATSRAYAVKFHESVDENADLVGLALANISAGLTGTFVVNGSPTKTEMVDSAGGRSQIAQLTAGAIVLVVLLFLTGPLAQLPLAALSAVVFLIGVKLVDLRHMAAVWKVARAEFWVATATAATVVLVGVEQGIVLAIVLSVIIHLSHSYRPFDYVLVRESDGHWHSRPLDSGEQADPGVTIYRFGASLYYANANRFDAEVRQLVGTSHPRPKSLIISAEAIGDIDYTGAEMFKRLVTDLDRQGVRLIVTDLAHNVREELSTYGLGDAIGWAHVHHGLTDAVADAIGETSEPEDEGVMT